MTTFKMWRVASGFAHVGKVFYMMASKHLLAGLALEICLVGAQVSRGQELGLALGTGVANTQTFPDEFVSDRSPAKGWNFLGRRRCRPGTTDPGVLMLWRGQSADAKVDGLDEGIVTDRPDFTEASSVVGRRVLQIESGYTYFYDGQGTNRVINHSYPETIFRYGLLADWLELRLGANYATEISSNDKVYGAEDLYLGCKIGLTAQDGWLPEMALVPQGTIPSGASEFTSGRTLPGINWLYGWDINDFLSFAGSTQVNRSRNDSAELYDAWAQSFTFGYTLTERVGAYTEWIGLAPSDSNRAPTEHYFDGGFTFGASDDVQFDVRGGKGLNDSASDYFVGVGMSIRFQ